MSLATLSRLSSALAGLFLILIAGMIPSALIVPGVNLSITTFSFPSSWQVPSLLLCGLILGPRSSLIATVAYLSIGLFFFPVFHGGGSIGYIATPDFGYLIGFCPAVWVVGRITKKSKTNSIKKLFLSAVSGLTVIHFIGIINIIIGSLLARWDQPLLELVVTYSLLKLPFHVLLCTPTALIAKMTRKILLIE